MANKIPCEIIQDLLPSYMDGLTNEVTNHAVEEHVETCESCRDTLYAMKTPVEPAAEQAEFQEEKQEIDFLKKTRKRNRWMVCSGIIVAVLIMFGLVFYNSYLRPHNVDPDLISCYVTVDGSEFTMSGRMLKEGEQLKMDYIANQHGVITVQLESKRYLFGDKASEYDGFHFTQEIDEPIKQIKIGDRIVWENGKNISNITSQVYATKHPHVGDMPANNETANALLMFQDFEYKNELQTTEEPYGWVFCLTEAPVNSYINADSLMQSYACVLFAVIDNLEVVTFENPDGTIFATFTVQEASEWMGQDIKSYGKSAADLQTLMEAVGLLEGRELRAEVEDLTVTIVNEAEDDVSMVTFDFYVNGDLRESAGVTVADGSMLPLHESISESISPNTMLNREEIESADLEVKITVYDEKGNGYLIKDPLSISVEFGQEYEYVLKGSADEYYYLTRNDE